MSSGGALLSEPFFFFFFTAESSIFYIYLNFFYLWFIVFCRPDFAVHARRLATSILSFKQKPTTRDGRFQARGAALIILLKRVNIYHYRYTVSVCIHIIILQCVKTNDY